MINAAELRDLAEMSARIGRDAALVQGPGGNTSIKDVVYGPFQESEVSAMVFQPAPRSMNLRGSAVSTKSSGQASSR